MNMVKKILLAILLVAFLLPVASHTSFGADKVIWNVGWIFYGRDLAWFNALEGGFWKAEGLDVKIVRGFGGTKAATDTAAGKNTIGGIDTASLILGRAKGLPLKMAFIQHDIPPFVVRTLEGNGVKSLKDLEGKKFGTPAGDASWANFPMLAKINGFDIKKMNVINVAPAVREQGLLGGQYAACTGFITQTPIVRRLAAKQGKKEKILLLANYGLEMYGYGYAVTDNTAATQGPMLKRLLSGT